MNIIVTDIIQPELTSRGSISKLQILYGEQKLAITRASYTLLQISEVVIGDTIRQVAQVRPSMILRR